MKENSTVTILAARSRTAQTPRSFLQALWVTTHSQQEALLGSEGFLSTEVQLVYSTAAANKARKKERKRKIVTKKKEKRKERKL